MRTPTKVQQSAFWTCGLACVAMVLGWTDDARLRAHHERLAGGPSVPWTVELLRYLREFLRQRQEPQTTGGTPRRVRMLTTSPGVASAATGAEFYAGMTPAELRRVAGLYHDEASGITAVPDVDLGAVAANRPWCCVFLVDARYLQGACRRCGPTPSLAPTPTGTGLDPVGYVGHYVLVTKIGTNDVWYLDPARRHGTNRPRHCVVPVDRFDAARRAPGTDQDCILVF